MSRYENLKIFTGLASEVQKSVTGYLNSHPNAQVLSSAVATDRPLPKLRGTALVTLTQQPPAKSESKEQSDNSVPTPPLSGDAEIEVTADASEDEPDIYVAVTVARVFAT